jgi:ferredoxin
MKTISIIADGFHIYFVYMKKIILYICTLFPVLSLLSGCKTTVPVNISADKNMNSDDFDAAVQVENKIIAVISEKCRGCGKCAIIDSEHFSINKSTHLAEVVTQSNLSSPDLIAAIAGCRDQAIKIQ